MEVKQAYQEIGRSICLLKKQTNCCNDDEDEVKSTIHCNLFQKISVISKVQTKCKCQSDNTRKGF